jgi:HlyD family secretion protein
MKKRWLIITLIIIAIFSVLMISLNRANKKAIEVKTATVKKGDITAYFSTSGTVESKNKKDYFGQGKVIRVNITTGDTVKKGNILIEFETQDPSLQLKTAQKQYENAKIQLEILKKQRDNQEDDNIPTSIPQFPQAANSQSLDDQIRMQQNQVEVARLNVESIKQNAAKQQKYIKADFDGIITAVNAVQGGISAPQMPAVTLEDVSSLQVAVNVNQYDITRLKVNQDAKVKFGGKSFKGRVLSINPTATKSMTQTGTDTSIKALIRLLENDGTLKPGFDVDVDVITDKKQNVLRLPAEALITDKEDNERVYVIQNDMAVLRDIETGITSDTEVEILKGLSEGDRVILNPTPNLRDNIKVNTVAEK